MKKNLVDPLTRQEVKQETEAEKWFREMEEEKVRKAKEAAEAEEEAKQKKKMKKVIRFCSEMSFCCVELYLIRCGLILRFINFFFDNLADCTS